MEVKVIEAGYTKFVILDTFDTLGRTPRNMYVDFY